MVQSRNASVLAIMGTSGKIVLTTLEETITVRIEEAMDKEEEFETLTIETTTLVAEAATVEVIDEITTARANVTSMVNRTNITTMTTRVAMENTNKEIVRTTKLKPGNRMPNRIITTWMNDPRVLDTAGGEMIPRRNI
jgi:DNA polymerase II large subunit